MPTNEERTAAARHALLAAARALFATVGYEGASTPEIAKRAGLTRGALYHHFADKKQVFEAVVEAEFAAVAARIEQDSAPASDPIEALVEGGDAFISALSDPNSVRILLVDAPRVLGQERLLELDNASTTASLRLGIEVAIKAGRLPRLDAAALTSLMSGAYDRAVLDNAFSPATDLTESRQAIRLIWAGLAKLA